MDLWGPKDSGQWHKVSLTGGAFQQSVLGPALLSVSINDVDDGAEWTFSRLAGDTELG